MMFYKEIELQDTPVGKIPKDWEITTLKDASSLITDGSHFSPKHQESGYPLATVANMRENGIDIDSCYRILREDYERLVESGDKPEIDDVLFSKDGTVGQCIVFNQKVDIIVLSSIAIIRPNLRKVDPYFLKYMLQSRSVLGRIVGSKTGTAIRRIILRDLSSTRIALPKKLEEQRGVVGVLGVVDSAIGLVDRVIGKTERLKKGLMQTLLTKGIGHKEYKQTPIGTVPKEWEVVKLKDIVEIDRESRDPSREIPDKTFLYVDIDSVDGSTGKIRRPKEILGKEAPSRARRVIHENDVVMSTVRPYLKAFAIVPRELDNQICSTGFAVLSCGSEILPYFLLNVLFSNQVINQCNRIMVGGQYPALNQSQVSEIKTPLPPLSEQQKIADIFVSIDRKVELERTEKEKLEKVKQGLMDLLLNGKVRVKVD